MLSNNCLCLYMYCNMQLRITCYYFSTDDKFQPVSLFYIVTRSYSSRPFLCTLDLHKGQHIYILHKLIPQLAGEYTLSTTLIPQVSVSFEAVSDEGPSVPTFVMSLPHDGNLWQCDFTLFVCRHQLLTH